MTTKPPIERRDWLSEHFIERGRPKQGFITFGEAKAEADRRNDRDKDEPEYRPSIPYRCGYCDEFHVGHSNPNKRRRGRR